MTKTLLGNNAPSYSITTELDELGRIRSITYPDGEIVGYAYDDGGNLWKAGGYATFTDYSADGRVGKVIHGNKVTTEYDYIQANNRLWSIKTTAPAGQQLLHKEYSYFGNGNMENIIDYRNAARSQSFTYDGLDRLKTSSAGSDSTTYGYDEIGNLIKNGNLILTPDTTRPQAVSSTYTKAEGSPDPTAVTTTGGQPMIIMVFLGDGFYPIPINQVGNNTIPANGLDRRTYSYDANGNMLSDGLRTFTWNENNLPSSITADGSTTSFVYDGFGQRVKKTGFSGSKIYINQLYEIANGGGVKYIYANGSRLALKTSMPAPLDVTYYHPDHLGSTVLVTNSNGQEIEDVFYEPFGEKAGGSGTVEMSHRFTGQALDEETDLYYYNARYYNPEIGRFISPDPFVPHLFNPQSLNRFSYVMNNPVNRVDPSGYADVTLTNSSGGGGSISVEPITVINLGDIPQNGRTSGGATAPTAVAAPLEGFGGNRVVYVQNNPINWIDPKGLLSEVVIWQPVGWGQSSFGHVSTNINGTTYSFGQKGMTILPTSEYLERNSFREGIGSVLNLTPDQESRLQACMSGNQGDYSSTGNNCGSPVQGCLDQLGFNFSNLFPVSLGNNLLDSGLVNQINFYPATTPSNGTSAPWAR